MHLFIILFSFVYIILPQIINNNSLFGLLAIILSIYFTVYYSKSHKYIKDQIKPIMLSDLLLVVLGGVSTFYLSFLTGPVLAAGIIGFTSFLIGKFHSKLIFIQFPIFCGSFVGMTTPLFFTAFWQITLASILAGIIYIFLKNHFLGYGGKLGSIAFTAVLILLFIKRIISG